MSPPRPRPSGSTRRAGRAGSGPKPSDRGTLDGLALPDLSARWLQQDLTIPPDNHGVYVPRWSIPEQAPFPTRTEEYHFITSILEDAPRGVVFDAGCGFNPDIHLLPNILGNMGFRVYAIDTNPDVLRMPSHCNIFWLCTSMSVDIFPLESFDYWLSVSVMEHVPDGVRDAALREAHRLLKRGGYVLLTTDETSPATVNGWLAKAGFETGPSEQNGESSLRPRVSCAVARK